MNKILPKIKDLIYYYNFLDADGEIRDRDVKPILRELVLCNQMLAEKLEKIPKWIFEYPCCPPGESCCNCD